ncbi:hypothetical protein CGRA01v4_06428 [Colletotrichum graminicola]|nr:hypothetical protein CGRA01v4_06428 [Colletotrichum graminicola]
MQLAVSVCKSLASRCSAAAKKNFGIDILQRRRLGNLAAKLVTLSLSLKEQVDYDKILHFLELLEGFVAPLNTATDTGYDGSQFQQLLQIASAGFDPKRLDAYLVSVDSNELENIIQRLTTTAEAPEKAPLGEETDYDHLRQLYIRCPAEAPQQHDSRLVSYDALLSLSPEVTLQSYDERATFLHKSTFYVASRSEEIPDSCLGLPIPRAYGRLCHILRHERRRNSKFFIHEGDNGPRMWDISSTLGPSQPGQVPVQVYSHSLEELMQAEKWIPSAGRDIRLAYIFALAIWQYYDTEWMPHPWTKSNIEITSEIDSDDCYPYINPSLWRGRTSSKGRETLEETRIAGYGTVYPKLMALGILMVELRKGPTYGDGSQTDMTEQRIRDNMDYFNYLPRYGRDWNPDYVNVIRKCFDSSLFQGSSGVESRQHIIEREIVIPLERLYRYAVCNEPPTRAITEPDESPDAEASQISIQAAVSLHDWRRVVWRDFVETNNQTAWKDEDTTARSLGHGSLIVSLLLRLLPKAKIFVGRIARTRKDLETKAAKQAIKDAIRWSVEPEQDVDIINLSFGFDQEVTGISDAIEEAIRVKKHKLLVFAAASNQGNGIEKFPASMHASVISVRGAGTSGDPIPAYNPRPMASTAPRMFCTLAENVPCDSAGHNMSGCSVATPILAATAALFLQYASLMTTKDPKVHGRQVQALYKKNRMEDLFRSIGRPMQKDLWYVQPKDLLRDSNTDIDHIIMAAEIWTIIGRQLEIDET